MDDSTTWNAFVENSPLASAVFDREMPSGKRRREACVSSASLLRNIKPRATGLALSTGRWGAQINVAQAAP